MHMICGKPCREEITQVAIAKQKYKTCTLKLWNFRKKVNFGPEKLLWQKVTFVFQKADYLIQVDNLIEGWYMWRITSRIG